MHYISRLQAIDTSERDRALSDLDATRRKLRTLELEHETLKVNLRLQAKEIDRLTQELRRAHSSAGQLGEQQQQQPDLRLQQQQQPSGGGGSSNSRLVYVRRIELVRSDAATDRDKYCRVLTYNEFHGMLVASQPSYTALAPGFGVRKINMVDQKADAFVPLHKAR